MTDGTRCEYPIDLLGGCKTALILFGAGFYGRSDGVWIAQAGLTATVVDVDHVRLDVMQRIYPDDWSFECHDADWYAASALAAGTQWDLLSIDPPISLCQDAKDLLPGWAELARDLIVMTTLENVDHFIPPDGWRVAACHWRSSAAAWLVLARDRDRRMGPRPSRGGMS